MKRLAHSVPSGLIFSIAIISLLSFLGVLTFSSRASAITIGDPYEYPNDATANSSVGPLDFVDATGSKPNAQTHTHYYPLADSLGNPITSNSGPVSYQASRALGFVSNYASYQVFLPTSATSSPGSINVSFVAACTPIKDANGWEDANYYSNTGTSPFIVYYESTATGAGQTPNGNFNTQTNTLGNCTNGNEVLSIPLTAFKSDPRYGVGWSTVDVFAQITDNKPPFDTKKNYDVYTSNGSIFPMSDSPAPSSSGYASGSTYNTGHADEAGAYSTDATNLTNPSANYYFTLPNRHQSDRWCDTPSPGDNTSDCYSGQTTGGFGALNTPDNDIASQCTYEVCGSSQSEPGDDGSENPSYNPGTSPAGENTFNFYFSPDCSYNGTQNVNLKWYRGIGSGSDQTDTEQFQILDETTGGNSITGELPLATVSNGGNGASTYSLGTTLHKGDVYDWEWTGVDKAHGITLVMPFSEFTSTGNFNYANDCKFSLSSSTIVSTPTSTDVSSSVLTAQNPNAGSQIATFSHTITNNGPTDATYDWQVENEYTDYSTGTSNGWNISNCLGVTEAGNNCPLHTGSDSNVPPGDTSNGDPYNWTIKYEFPNSASPGDQYCQRVVYTNGEGPGSTGNVVQTFNGITYTYASTEACVTYEPGNTYTTTFDCNEYNLPNNYTSNAHGASFGNTVPANSSFRVTVLNIDQPLHSASPAMGTTSGSAPGGTTSSSWATYPAANIESTPRGINTTGSSPVSDYHLTLPAPTGHDRLVYVEYWVRSGSGTRRSPYVWTYYYFTQADDNCYSASCTISFGSADTDVPTSPGEPREPHPIMATGGFTGTYTITNTGTWALPETGGSAELAPVATYNGTNYPPWEAYNLVTFSSAGELGANATFSGTYSEPAPGSEGAYTFTAQPEYSGVTGSWLGAACTPIPVNAYSYFNMTPTASLGTFEPENPSSFTWSTNVETTGPGDNGLPNIVPTPPGTISAQYTSTLTSNGNVIQTSGTNTGYYPSNPPPYQYQYGNGDPESDSNVNPPDQYCANMTLTYARGYIWTSGGSTDISDGQSDTQSACQSVYNEPYFKVYGSGVESTCTANGEIQGWNDDNGSNPSTDANDGLGSGAQLSALALTGGINGFASGQDGSTYTSNSGAYRGIGLSFANIDTTNLDQYGVSSSNTPKMGGYYGTSTSSACNSFSAPSSSVTWDSSSTDLHSSGDGNETVDISSIPSGNYIYNGTGNLIIDVPVGSSIAEGKIIKIYTDSTKSVYIENNIPYDTNPPTPWCIVQNTTSCPQDGSESPPFVQVVSTNGDIFISPNVKQLDGMYVAEGTATNAGKIFTCSASTSPDSNEFSAMARDNLYSGCDKQLVVTGSFVAQQVNLMRTYGSLRDSINSTNQAEENPRSTTRTCSNDADDGQQATCAAEVFDFSPEMYLSDPDSQFTISGLQPASFTSLPPVL
jgi:hypothetical protein